MNSAFLGFTSNKRTITSSKTQDYGIHIFQAGNRESEIQYKPRYYDPKKEESTGDARKDFARNLHDEWQSRRNHTSGERKNHNSLTIIFMIFFVIVLALVLWKFF